MIIPVRLNVGFGQNYAVSGMTFTWSSVFVNVQNIAYNKTVRLHYKGPAGVWHDFDLRFAGHFGDFDIFGDNNAPTASEFAIEYIVQVPYYPYVLTVWDNNNFANYRIAGYVGTVGGNVMLKNAVARTGTEGGGGFTVTTSWFDGEIYVSNPDTTKKVGIVYTADGITWSNVDAKYDRMEKGVAAEISKVEIWKFKTPVLNYNSVSDVFKFAVYCNSDWDNNFTQDYKLQKSSGSKIGL